MARVKLTPVRVNLVQLGKATVDESSVVLLCVQTDVQENKESAVGPAFMRCTMKKKEFQFKIPEDAKPKGYLQSFRFKDVRAAVVAYNVAKSTSFDEVKTWVKELQCAYPKIVIALIGSQVDLVLKGSGSSINGMSNPQRQVSKDKAQAYAKDADLLFCETSAETGAAVVDAFKHFASKILVEHVLPSEKGSICACDACRRWARASKCGVIAGAAGSDQSCSNDHRVKLSKAAEIVGSETEDTQDWETVWHFKDCSDFAPPKSDHGARTMTPQDSETVGQAEPVSEILLSLDHSPVQHAPVQTSLGETSQAHIEAGAELNIEQDKPLFSIEEAAEYLGGQWSRTNFIHDGPVTLLDLKKPPPDFEVSLVRRPLDADDLAALQGPEPTPAAEVVAMVPFECAENALAYCLKTVSELLATLPPPKPDELERRRATLAAINNIALNLRDERVPRE